MDRWMDGWERRKGEREGCERGKGRGIDGREERERGMDGREEVERGLRKVYSMYVYVRAWVCVS